MHPVVLKSSQLILAGDIAGAENALATIADEQGDHALVEILDELQPKDLLAVMREFDSSKESVVNMLVTPEQFARSIVLEKKYGDRTSERLRAMMNAVIYRDESTVHEYLEAMANIEGGSDTLADYFADHYDEIFSFSRIITMESHAKNYLNERRQLGFGLRNPGYAVLSFGRYIDTLNSQEPLTVEIMADRARQDQGHSDQPANLGATTEKSTFVLPLPTTI